MAAFVLRGWLEAGDLNQGEFREQLQRRAAAVRARLGCITAAYVHSEVDSQSPLGNLRLRPNASVAGRTGNLRLTYRESLAAAAETNARTVFMHVSIDDFQTGREILAFHIHDGEPRRHYHLGAGAGALLAPLYKAHIPAGEIDERAFIRMLIVDFGVRPLRRNWRTVLAES